MADDTNSAMDKAIAAGRVRLRPIPHPFPRDKVSPQGAVLDPDKRYTFSRTIDGVRYTYNNVPVVKEDNMLLLDPSDPKILINAAWADGKD